MKKAISPVIATVIIVAVTIAIAIAVALWMSGLVGSFTQTEKLEITTAYADQVKDIRTSDTSVNVTGWKITLEIKNTGTTDATIDNIFINGKPYTSFSTTNNAVTLTIGVTSDNSPLSSPLSIPLKAGGTIKIYITIPKDLGFTSGQMIEVKIHTASGKEYPKQVTLT